MTDNQYTILVSKLSRIEERIENIKEKLDDGAERFEAHEKRMTYLEKRLQMCETKYESHDFFLKLAKWIGGLLTTIGLGALVHWLTSAKH